MKHGRRPVYNIRNAKLLSERYLKTLSQVNLRQTYHRFLIIPLTWVMNLASDLLKAWADAMQRAMVRRVLSGLTESMNMGMHS